VCAVGERLSSREYERERERAREREDAHTQTAQARVLMTAKQRFQRVIFRWRFRFRVIFFFFRKLSFCTKGFGRLICENGLASRMTVRCLLPASLLCASAVVDFIFIFLFEKEVARLPGWCWNFRNPCRLIFGERLFLVRIGLFTTFVLAMCLHGNSFVFW
jgi:hypothetical protein